MNVSAIKDNLAQNGMVFHSLLSGLKENEFTWKSSPEKWCLLEIVCHLYDEERYDFRYRTKHILETPGLPMPPIDPPGWVVEHDYMKQDFQVMLTRFLEERNTSVAWLSSAMNMPWNNVHHHPRIGELSAIVMLTNWLAHDYHHIRQINRLKYLYLKQISGQDLSYAGDW